MHKSYSLILVIFTVFWVAPAVAQTNPSERLSKIKIYNFGQIDEYYFRGAEPHNDEFLELVELGIKSVINLKSEKVDPNEKGMVEKAGMKYFQIPMSTHRVPTDSEVSSFLNIISSPENQPVYVQCVDGRHRTGVLTAVYRMNHYGWSADQAFEEMQKFKFGPALFHSQLKNFVYSYYSHLLQMKSALK